MIYKLFCLYLVVNVVGTMCSQSEEIAEIWQGCSFGEKIEAVLLCTLFWLPGRMVAPWL